MSIQLSIVGIGLLTGILAIFIALAFKRIWHLRQFPPGPWGLPIIGSLIHLNKNNALVEFEKYQQKYGPIFSVGIGSFTVIVINGYKRIQEALKIDALNGRPHFETWTLQNGGFQNRGILDCDGNSTWNEQRRFALRHLRDFGFGKQSMEGLLINELEELIKHMKKDLGRPICVRMFFNASVLNSLWYILTGRRFDLNDAHFQKLVSMLSTNNKNSNVAGPVLFFVTPVKYLRRKFWNQMISMRLGILNMMKVEVAEHVATYQPGVNRDFIDVYLHKREADPNSSFGSDEGMNNLAVVLKDLFFAGSETTSTTLFWSILYLTQNPEVQVKVQAQLDAVVGRDRLPSLEDKPKLVYIDAVLNEVHRSASLLPMSVFHKVLEDTYFEGHFFPKDTVILPNLYEAHHNRDYWKDPENFRPERFLNETGTALVHYEAFMPFSTGKRICLGEALARDTLFLFFTGLFQQFSFELAPESRNIKLTSDIPTFVTSPDDFKVIITERKA